MFTNDHLETPSSAAGVLLEWLACESLKIAIFLLKLEHPSSDTYIPTFKAGKAFIWSIGYYAYVGDHFVRYVYVESLCCAPETNIILYIDYSDKIF